MNIELIPVIEVGYNNQGIIKPEKYPYWENAEIWNTYHQKSWKKAGFLDELEPYLKGSSFLEAKYISDNNLKKIVIDHTENLRNGECQREDISCLFGGFVLKIDGDNKYFPQCCGDLGDIKYWKKVSQGKNSYYEGHPVPNIKFQYNKVKFISQSKIGVRHYCRTLDAIKKNKTCSND